MPEEDRAPVDPKFEDRRRKAYMLAKKIGFTDQERYEYANMVLHPAAINEITSWRQLTDSQMMRLLDALEGVIYYEALKLQRV